MYARGGFQATSATVGRRKTNGTISETQKPSREATRDGFASCALLVAPVVRVLTEVRILPVRIERAAKVTSTRYRMRADGLFYLMRAPFHGGERAHA
jgi:hypothetical protein